MCLLQTNLLFLFQGKIPIGRWDLWRHFGPMRIHPGENRQWEQCWQFGWHTGSPEGHKWPWLTFFPYKRELRTTANDSSFSGTSRPMGQLWNTRLHFYHSLGTRHNTLHYLPARRAHFSRSLLKISVAGAISFVSLWDVSHGNFPFYSPLIGFASCYPTVCKGKQQHYATAMASFGSSNIWSFH